MIRGCNRRSQITCDRWTPCFDCFCFVLAQRISDCQAETWVSPHCCVSCVRWFTRPSCQADKRDLSWCRDIISSWRGTGVGIFPEAVISATILALIDVSKLCLDDPFLLYIWISIVISTHASENLFLFVIRWMYSDIIHVHGIEGALVTNQKGKKKRCLQHVDGNWGEIFLSFYWDAHELSYLSSSWA